MFRLYQLYWFFRDRFDVLFSTPAKEGVREHRISYKVRRFFRENPHIADVPIFEEFSGC